MDRPKKCPYCGDVFPGMCGSWWTGDKAIQTSRCKERQDYQLQIEGLVKALEAMRIYLANDPDINFGEAREIVETALKKIGRDPGQGEGRTPEGKVRIPHIKYPHLVFDEDTGGCECVDCGARAMSTSSIQHRHFCKHAGEIIKT